MATGRLLALTALLVFAGMLTLTGIASPASAGDFGACNDTAYWCTRDAIYHRTKLISLLEANPDIDEAVKGPQITVARAEIRALRATLGPPQWNWPTPCCYSRKPLHIR
jgi:hypothetical protein